MKKSGTRLFTCLLTIALLMPVVTSCDKSFKRDDLIGTWAYQDNKQYTITFREDGTMGYTAPQETPYYTPTYTLEGIFIHVRVIVGSATISDVVEIRSLSPTTLVVYYDGDLLFDNQSLNGEYVLLKR
ncbi:MAG: hypothetical protein GX877_05950 [Bacteroidales bacterium]|nr:hypothetical protein [Bacteroidales bacterium]